MKQKYVWQQADWPNFKWDSEAILQKLGHARKIQGQMLAQAHLLGLLEHADFIVEEAFATSAIEGEKLDRADIRSSVANRLNLDRAGYSQPSRKVDGLVEMLIDATANYKDQLTIKRLHGWHAGIFTTGYSGIHKIQIGRWRTGDEPMQVISGSFYKEKIHFEAPPSTLVSMEIKSFLVWWKKSFQSVDGLLRAAIAHFWFVTIHPYDDGNGRISRAITDMALAQDEQLGKRFYNLSTQIIKERDAYYTVLESCQKGSCDITPWLDWFLGIYSRALENSKVVIEKVLLISKFWQKCGKLELNQRQVKVIQKLLEAEPSGFEGGMNNRKYVSITRTSRETAKRDLLDLEEKGILKRNEAGGRSTSYSLVNLTEKSKVGNPI